MTLQLILRHSVRLIYEVYISICVRVNIEISGASTKTITSKLGPRVT